MTENKTQKAAEAASDLSDLLGLAEQYLNTEGIKPCNPDFLIKQMLCEIEKTNNLFIANKSLNQCLNIATLKIEQLTKELLQIKEANHSQVFKDYWLMNFAGLAMQSQLSQIDIVEYDANYRAIARESFLAAKEMIDVFNKHLTIAIRGNAL